MRKKYRVTGSVMKFGVCIGKKTKETVAENVSKAKNNAMYQVKKDLNLGNSTRLSWGGDVVVTDLGGAYY